MTNVITYQRFWQRRDTAANWTAANPVLADGEIGVVTGTNPPRFKIGDGVTAWTALAFSDYRDIEADARVADGIATHEADPDPHLQYLTQAEGDALYAAAGTGATPSTTRTANEALAAGDFVNITAAGVRLAKATPGYEAHGFVLAAVASSATATIYLAGGMNTGLAGLTIGATYFLSSTAGAVTDDVTGYAAGTLIHRIGVAVSATAIDFNPQFPIERA